MSKERYKAFNDPVHGTILLHPLLVKIIDSPQFQRLRNIKQLGAAYYVYPEAQHNRFEHSIGTAHLAGKLIRHLRDNQSVLGIDDKDVLCVEIAGLCHDLGHGPFSHLFDAKFMRRIEEKNGTTEKWSHEKKSCEIFDDLIASLQNDEEYNRSGLLNVDLVFIKELINGPLEGNGTYKGRKKEKWFLYEIISNKESGVDVDKWDYFARDCHHLGIANGFDHNRFIPFMKVLEVDGNKRLCVRDKQSFELYEMFHTRFVLHKRACQHKVVNAIEHMICDAMILADDHIEIPKENGTVASISQSAKDNKAFLNLDDGILQKILHSKCEEARVIVQRILRRDHYRCVGDEILSSDQRTLGPGKICEELAGFDPGLELSTDDIAVSVVKLNYGKEEKNPVEYYWFYTKQKPEEAKRIPKKEVSVMLPEIFEERRVQVFSKNRKNISNLQKAFKQWYNKPEPVDFKNRGETSSRKRGSVNVEENGTKRVRRVSV